MRIASLSLDSRWFILFNLLNSLLASAICLANFPGDALFWSIQSLLFSVSAVFAHFFFLFLLTSYPLWFFGGFTPSLKLRFHLVTLASIALLIIVYLDARIFELYKFHLNGMVIELISGGALQDILAFEPIVWTLFASIAMIFIVLELLLAKVLLHAIKTFEFGRNLAWFSIAIFIISALLSQSIYILSDAKGDTTITSLKRYIPWAQTITAKRRLRELGIQVTAKDSPNLSYRSDIIHYPKEALQCLPDEKYNVLLIVVDSLRFDMLDPDIMPNTWQLAEASHRYTDYYSLSNSTRFGIFTLMYGLSGNYWHSMLNIQKGSVLFDLLIDLDYQFFINAAAPLYSPEFDRTVFVKVKDNIRSAPSKLAVHEKDRFITDLFTQQLEERSPEKSFFAFMFFDSPHAYAYPASFKERFTPSWEKINYLELDRDFEPTAFFNRYKNSAAYTDKLIGETLKSLDENHLRDNTIIIFTSDHGQEFNESGDNYWGHNGNFSRYQTKVPFVIHWPSKHPLHGSRVFEQQSASMDMLPTLLKEGFKCRNDIGDYSSGFNLYDLDNDYSRPIVFESWSKRAVMGKDYILVSHDAGGSELFDRDYQPLSDFEPPKKDFSRVFRQISAFNNKKETTSHQQKNHDSSK